MNDTSLEVAAQFDRLMARRFGGGRVRMACAMCDLARKRVEADIRARHPGLGAGPLRALLFDRLYGDDFPSEQRARLRARLTGARG